MPSCFRPIVNLQDHASFHKGHARRCAGLVLVRQHRSTIACLRQATFQLFLGRPDPWGHNMPQHLPFATMKHIPNDPKFSSLAQEISVWLRHPQLGEIGQNQITQYFIKHGRWSYDSYLSLSISQSYVCIHLYPRKWTQRIAIDQFPKITMSRTGFFPVNQCFYQYHNIIQYQKNHKTNSHLIQAAGSLAPSGGSTTSRTVTCSSVSSWVSQAQPASRRSPVPGRARSGTRESRSLPCNEAPQRASVTRGITWTWWTWYTRKGDQNHPKPAKSI